MMSSVDMSPVITNTVLGSFKYSCTRIITIENLKSLYVVLTDRCWDHVPLLHMRFLDSLLPLHHLLIASFPFEAYYVRLWTCVTLAGSLLQHGDWADIFRSATWTRLAYWHESGYSFAVSRIFSWLISILQISFLNFIPLWHYWFLLNKMWMPAIWVLSLFVSEVYQVRASHFSYQNRTASL